MKINHPIEISFEAFFRSGHFDFLEIGQVKDWILQNFPDPDGWDGSKAMHEASIWRYGNIELHFSGEKLAFLFSDYILELDGGPSLVLDKWILAQSNSLSLNNVITNFLESEIDFQIVHSKIQGLRQISMILTQSGVKLLFEPSEEGADSNSFQLGAFVWGLA